MDAENKFRVYPNKPAIIEKYFIDNPKTVEYWSNQEVEAYTLEALNQLLSHVYPNNAFYRQKMDESGIAPGSLRSLEDFQKMRTTSKDELRADPYLIYSAPKGQIAQVFLSTGTTGGESIYMIHTWEDLYLRDLGPDMPDLALNKDMGLVAIALPFEMSSSGLSFYYVLQHGCSVGVVTVGKGGFYSKPHKTVKALKELNVGGMYTTPSYAMVLADAAFELGYKLGEDIVMKRIWLTGEGCSDAFRRRIEDVWQTQALYYYGSLECGPLGIECTRKSGYHLPSAHVYIEVIDPETGAAKANGEIGEIVATTLLRTGSPLIRFRTGDLGYIEDTPCECGMNLKRLFLRGRVCDQIKIGNVNFSPFYVEELLMRIQEVGNNYRLIVYDDYLEIETELAPMVRETESLAEQIASRIEYGCGLPCRVRFIDKIRYEGGKTVRVIYRQTKTEQVGEGED